MEVTDEISTFSNDYYDNDTRILSKISRIELKCNDNVINNIDHRRFCNIVKSIILNEYNLRTNILNNMTVHVEKLYREFIIHHKIRNKMLAKLNSMIEELSNSYNEIIKKYRKITYNITNKECSILKSSITVFEKYIGLYDNSIRTTILEYYEDFDNDMLFMMTSIGSSTIYDIFNLTYGKNFSEKLKIEKDRDDLIEKTKNNKKKWSLLDLMKNMHNSLALLPLISKNFTPIEIYVTKTENKPENNIVLIKRYNQKTNNEKTNNEKLNKYSEEKIDEEKIKYKFEILLDNSYKITIKLKNTRKCFVIFGYFNYDNINSFIRTSQISNNFIFLKKKLLIDYVSKNTTINSNFRNSYMQIINLGEILSFKG
jgi:hypothetical protein